MSKREYLSLLLSQPVRWLEGSAANPSEGMRPIHIKLHYVALRRLKSAGRA